MHFRRSRQKVTDVKFIYGNTNLNIVSEYKYLGVILDENITFTKCSKTLAKSWGRALSSIISKFKTFKDLGYKTYTSMYLSGVVPILDYGSSIWSYNAKNNHSNMIQNKASRYFLCVHNFTPIPALVGEMGWLPCKYRKMINTLRFWNRLIKMPNDRLTKYIFNRQYELTTDNWCKHVKDILNVLTVKIYIILEFCVILMLPRS